MGYQTVTESTLRKNVYNTIFTLLNTYKINGWTIFSAFPEKDPVFPCLVVNPANITIRKIGMKLDARMDMIEVIVEIFCKQSDRSETIDLAKDNITNTILTYESTLGTYKLLINDEEPFVDSPVDQVEFGGQKLNTSAISLVFQLQ
jgi:hypothetical protein